MTKKDFFRVLIKVFGLYSLILALFTFFPSQLSFVLYEIELIGILIVLGMLTFIVLIFVFLIKKPDTIINWLKLDQGFDEERIHFEKLNVQNIIKIAALIIGGLLLIDSIPVFLSHTYFAFKSDIAGSGLDNKQYTKWAISFLNILLGYLLVANFARISKWLKNKEE
ncbi:hypothetical protein JYU16_01820 [bacterium AH-315-M05]|nr:hypothetical protein [bacterium AH-315-M05]